MKRNEKGGEQSPPDPLNDLFHGSAFAAYLDIWAETGQFPPDSAAVKARAYRYYEEELANRAQV